jgi:hypothetical protein
MSKPVSPSRFSLRSGAVLFSLLASLGACATIDTPRRGFATASAVEPAQLASWGFATVAAPSQPTLHGYAKVTEPVQPAVWGYVLQPSAPMLVTQTNR